VHPLAKAMVKYAKSLEEQNPHISWKQEVHGFEVISGHGVRANVGNEEVVIGNKRLMEDLSIPIPLEVKELVKRSEDRARTTVMISVGNKVVGMIAIADSVKPEASSAMKALKSMGIEVIMVTGDNWGTAKAVAKEVGINTVIAEALPSTKADKIKDLQVMYFD
jgi:Cu+-exporting ATPase